MVFFNALSVSFPAFLGLLIFLDADFASILKSVLGTFLLAKFFGQLSLLAHPTSLFHLASFKQNKSPLSEFCWMPIAAVTLQIRGLINYDNYLIV